MNIIDRKGQARWEETINSIDFTHSSHKAWITINQLTERSSKANPCPVMANSIASVLLDNGKWKDNSEKARQHTWEVNQEIKHLLVKQPTNSKLSASIRI